MARDDRDEAPRLPLLQALLDDDPEASVDPRSSVKAQLKQLRESVRKDLEELLNTRQRCQSPSKEHSELQRSVFEYGVPDITGANLASPKKRAEFLKELGAVIRRHDPRLQSVNLTSLDNTDPHDRTLRFRIEAALRVESGQETAIFDFQLEPVTRHFE